VTVQRKDYSKDANYYSHEKDADLFLALIVLFAGGIVGAALLGFI
jgi:hypothetical protein